MALVFMLLIGLLSKNLYTEVESPLELMRKEGKNDFSYYISNTSIESNKKYLEDTNSISATSASRVTGASGGSTAITPSTDSSSNTRRTSIYRNDDDYEEDGEDADEKKEDSNWNFSRDFDKENNHENDDD